MALTIGELARLALAVYDNPPDDTGSWTFVRYWGTLGQNGFFAALFRDAKDERHVFAIRGTDGGNDLLDDLAVSAGTIGEQMVMARAALKDAQREANHTKCLVLTGHSLGGGLAALLAVQTGLHCVTFNAPGTARSYGELFAEENAPFPVIRQLLAAAAPFAAYTGRIINLRAAWDVVSVGTGPRLGRVDSIQVRGCDPLTEFQMRQPAAFPPRQDFGRKAPAKQALDVMARGATFFLCQHSMEQMVNELAYRPDYNRDLGW